MVVPILVLPILLTSYSAQAGQASARPATLGDRLKASSLSVIQQLTTKHGDWQLQEDAPEDRWEQLDRTKYGDFLQVKSTDVLQEELEKSFPLLKRLRSLKLDLDLTPKADSRPDYSFGVAIESIEPHEDAEGITAVSDSVDQYGQYASKAKVVWRPTTNFATVQVEHRPSSWTILPEPTPAFSLGAESKGGLLAPNRETTRLQSLFDLRLTQKQGYYEAALKDDETIDHLIRLPFKSGQSVTSSLDQLGTLQSTSLASPLYALKARHEISLHHIEEVLRYRIDMIVEPTAVFPMAVTVEVHSPVESREPTYNFGLKRYL